MIDSFTLLVKGKICNKFNRVLSEEREKGKESRRLSSDIRNGINF